MMIIVIKTYNYHVEVFYTDCGYVVLWTVVMLQTRQTHREYQHFPEMGW